MIINRSEAEALYPFDYTIQEKSKSAVYWNTVLETNNKELSIEHEKFLRKSNPELEYRIIYNLA